MKLFLDSDPAVLINQGELIEWRTNEVWQRWGIVITADCDIDNSKFWGRLSVAPVETASTVISTLFSLQFLQKQRQKLIDALIGELSSGDDGQVTKSYAETIVESGIDGLPGGRIKLSKL